MPTVDYFISFPDPAFAHMSRRSFLEPVAERVHQPPLPAQRLAEPLQKRKSVRPQLQRPHQG